VCVGPGPLLVFSAETHNGRADYRASPDVRFIDARGRRARRGEFDTDGAAILRRRGSGTWTLCPLGEMNVLNLNAAALGLRGPAELVAYDESDRLIRKTRADVRDGLVSIPVDATAFRYDLIEGIPHRGDGK